METLTSFSLQSGRVTETYTVEIDAVGEVFVRCELDTCGPGPIDTIHIDARALRPIALALLAAATQVQPEPHQIVVVRFPSRLQVV